MFVVYGVQCGIFATILKKMCFVPFIYRFNLNAPGLYVEIHKIQLFANIV